MKTPDDFLARLLPPTPEDEAGARQRGVSLEEYRTMKRHGLLEPAAGDAGGTKPPPDDIAAEDATSRQLRREAGFFKPRNSPPNLLVQAARTPGEVAKLILFVLCYTLALAGLVILGGERVRRMPGIFQCVALGLLVIPTIFITDRVWEASGERARDLIRTLVRFWPLTLLALVLALGALKLLGRQLLH